MTGSLEEALGEISKDSKFLLEGGVFAEEFVHLWINYKKKTEADPVRMRPHPYEFHLYYDI
jgi:glutamine synthetase